MQMGYPAVLWDEVLAQEMDAPMNVCNENPRRCRGYGGEFGDVLHRQGCSELDKPQPPEASL